MTCSLSRAAESDIIGIYVWTAQEFGMAQADAYHEGLESAFGFIAEFPRAARERSEIDPPVRVHAYKSHIIVYVLDGDDVRVLRVRHGREDWESLT